jgi:NAD(P)-dependent dehydrogenase (short-subunit alcohol dehydrogenase family)
MQRLKNKIAVVTGASRGGGRGIALVLGEEGATVYVTGRSVRGSPTPRGLPETIDETAELVTARGGVGIPVRCDHTVDSEVEALFERVEKEQGRLDILVNNVWGGYESFEKWYDPFWEQPLWRWEKMFSAGVRAHYTASHFAVPRMLSNRQGLIVSTTFWDRGKCLANLFYDLAKTAINRMAYVMALELREHNIAAVALSPGWMRTEEVLREYGITPDELNYQVFEEHDRTESVYYIGRAVAALAADPNVMEKSGRILALGDLAREYGFTDIDGRQPPAYRMKEEHLRD